MRRVVLGSLTVLLVAVAIFAGPAGCGKKEEKAVPDKQFSDVPPEQRSRGGVGAPTKDTEKPNK